MALINAQYKYNSRQKLMLGILGFIIFFVAWWGLAELLSEQKPVVDYDTRPPSSITVDSLALAQRDSILEADSIAYANATEFEKIYPLLSPPDQVFSRYPGLINPAEYSWWFPEDGGRTRALIPNALISMWRNIQGYFWAVFFSLLIGIPVALSPTARALFARQIDVMRYLPLTALTPLFIIAFGTGEALKVSFLAFGILVYLLPVVMQRVWETEDVYLKTSFTLGASDWQLVKSVYLPSVLGKLIDDIRVLTAISWTYIIIAESLNRDAGLGGLIYIFARQGDLPSVYAVLIFIVLIGFLQDQLFVYINRRLFPFKSLKSTKPGIGEVQLGMLTILGVTMIFLLLQMLTGSSLGNLGTFVGIICVAGLVFIGLGEFKIWRPEPVKSEVDA
ncbi:MAG: ABC transporter permease subunit [Bacteroidota bacterium]